MRGTDWNLFYFPLSAITNSFNLVDDSFNDSSMPQDSNIIRLGLNVIKRIGLLTFQTVSTGWLLDTGFWLLAFGPY